MPMDVKPFTLLIASSVLAAILVFGAGCGGVATEKSDVRELPDQVRTGLAKGDTRERVRAVLGTPMIDAEDIGLEVYRTIGHDWDFLFPFIVIPIPLPVGSSAKVVSFALVLYDEWDRVNEISADTWTSVGSFGFRSDPDFRISAGGFLFANTFGEQPSTLLGPAIPGKELEQSKIKPQSCSLFLIIEECVTKSVSIDHRRIAEMSPDETYCAVKQNNKLHGAFLRIDLIPGSHRIRFNSENRESSFEAEFDCSGGDLLYAGLDADVAHDTGWGSRLQGSIFISTSLPERLVKLGDFRPILQHLGTWYGGSYSLNGK